MLKQTTAKIDLTPALAQFYNTSSLFQYYTHEPNLKNWLYRREPDVAMVLELQYIRLQRLPQLILLSTVNQGLIGATVIKKTSAHKL